jgi:Fur family transcriptional regulator, ferric uptake regulator
MAAHSPLGHYWPQNLQLPFHPRYLGMNVVLTRSQDRILQLLKQLQRAVSAQDIYVELRNRSQGVGLATVYRALEALKLAGVVQARTLASGESLYSSLQEDRHHLTCLHCQASIPISECPVHQLEAELQSTHNFQVFYHTLEFFGVCHNCVDRQAIEPEHSHDHSAGTVSLPENR